MSPLPLQRFTAEYGEIEYGGLPVFFITRAGMGFCVRPNRYALALSTGSTLGADVFALHECDNPVCVEVSGPGALREDVVAGTQFDNMRRMARARRGGGRPTVRGLGCEARRARSVALREAVQGCERPSGSICDSLAANGGGKYLPTYVQRVLAVF